MPDVKLSRFESFPKESFTPGAWVKFERAQLIAVPDTARNAGQCNECLFVGKTGVPSSCRLEEPEFEPRACDFTGDVNAGMLNGTVRFIERDTYLKLRIKGEL